MQEHTEMLKSLRRNHDCTHFLLYRWAATLTRSNLQRKPVISSVTSKWQSIIEGKQERYLEAGIEAQTMEDYC